VRIRARSFCASPLFAAALPWSKNTLTSFDSHRSAYLRAHLACFDIHPQNSRGWQCRLCKQRRCAAHFARTGGSGITGRGMSVVQRVAPTVLGVLRGLTPRRLRAGLISVAPSALKSACHGDALGQIEPGSLAALPSRGSKSAGTKAIRLARGGAQKRQPSGGKKCWQEEGRFDKDEAQGE
jgi:hypothetical protein